MTSLQTDTLYSPPDPKRPPFARLPKAQYTSLKFKAFERALVQMADALRIHDFMLGLRLDDAINGFTNERRRLVLHNTSDFEPAYALFGHAWRVARGLRDAGHEDAAAAMELVLTAYLPNDLTWRELGLKRAPSSLPRAVTANSSGSSSTARPDARRSRRTGVTTQTSKAQRKGANR